MTQNRWTSVPMLTALAAQLLSVLVLLGIIDLSQSEALEAVIIAICEALTAFGVLNNPTSKTSF